MRNKLYILNFIFIFTFFSVIGTQTSFAENYNFKDLINSNFETERLLITPTTDEDLEKLSEYLLDKETSYLDPTIKDSFKTKEEALNFLKSDGSEEIKSSMKFTVKLKDSKVPIGKLDFMLFKNSVLSVGYWLGKDFQGEGYMSEACLDVCNKVFNASDIKIFYIACDFRNQNSINLAEKIFDYIEDNSPSNLSRIRKEHNINCRFNGKEISFHYIEMILQKN